MTANTSNDSVSIAAQIVAAYAANPNVSVSQSDLMAMFVDVHAKTRAMIQGADVAAQAPAVAEAPVPTAPASSEPVLSEAIAQTLAGSAVYSGMDGVPDDERDAKIWPDATPAQRRKFRALMAEYHIMVGPDGRPLPRRQIEKLVENWQVYDPISGHGYKMLKRHISVSYGLTHDELVAMFHLPKDFPQTAPAYSEAKRRQALQGGLGRADGTGRPAPRGKAKSKENAAA